MRRGFREGAGGERSGPNYWLRSCFMISSRSTLKHLCMLWLQEQEAIDAATAAGSCCVQESHFGLAERSQHTHLWNGHVTAVATWLHSKCSHAKLSMDHDMSTHAERRLCDTSLEKVRRVVVVQSSLVLLLLMKKRDVAIRTLPSDQSMSVNMCRQHAEAHPTPCILRHMKMVFPFVARLKRFKAERCR